jgi:predicted nucleotidyltransferase
MATTKLPPDFKEFLRLLNSQRVEYLLVGGYAVGYYGYPRATADLDLWVSPKPENAHNLQEVLKQFGFQQPEITQDLLTHEDKIIRMGVPPVRIELLTSVTALRFDECYQRRQNVEIDSVQVHVLGLEDLKTNKKACGRNKDKDDLEHLP